VTQPGQSEAALPPVNHVAVAALGLITISAYGSWYYAFGVLLDPVRSSTGWAESTLAASFSVGQIIVGVAAVAGGRLLDRSGHGVVFGMAGVFGPLAMLLASYAQSVGVFFVGSALALGVLGSLAFYHVTMTAAVRSNPQNSTKAIATLTIWGAFASAIYLPVTAWLIDAYGWRTAVRVLAVIAAIVHLGGLLAVPALPRETNEAPASPRQIVRWVVGRPLTRLFTAAIAFGGIAMATMLVYQVPVMTTAGLSATVAATMAGARGLCQLLGRLPLTPLVNSLGADRALQVAFAAMAVGGALLAIAGNVPIAIAFAAIAGFGIGAFSPLQGMKAEELFDRDNLGATMGFYAMVMLLAGSLGPFGAGVLSEQTGDRRWVAVVVVVSSLAAAVCVWGMRRVTPQLDQHSAATQS